MENVFGDPRVRNAGRRVRDPQRARGHGEPHGRGPASGLVGERECPDRLERTMQDLYAGSLARTSFALVMLAIAGGMALAARRHRDLRRHRLRRLAENSRNRDSVGARRRAAAAREDVPAARARAQRSGRRGRARRGRGVGTFDVLAACSVSSRWTPQPMSAAIGVILAAAALASYLPARRAATIDPDRDAQGGVVRGRIGRENPA